MRKSILRFVLAVLFMPLLCEAQTVFSYSVDTLFVSDIDRATIVDGKGHVFSVGDTVSAGAWYTSADSVNWFPLTDFYGRNVKGDSIMIDTLAVAKFYGAVLTAGAPMDYIVWRIDNIVYKSLEAPVITNDGGIDRTEILLLDGDSLWLFATFEGLKPDTVVWYKDGVETDMPVRTSGIYGVTGYLFNHVGTVIDSAVSEVYTVDFAYPLEKVIFKSWAGSNDGNPRVVDTLSMCVCEIVLDTLVFSVNDPYKYQLVPVLRSFDKSYNFSYKWEYSGFAIVEEMDSVLQFNPIGFKHSGSYVFITTWDNGVLTADYRATPVRIVAYNVSNEMIDGGYIENGTIYSVTGAVVRHGVSGYYADIVRGLNVPKGVYILRAGKGVYKFIK